jgi:hypothetical protein
VTTTGAAVAEGAAGAPQAASKPPTNVIANRTETNFLINIFLPPDIE